MAALDGLSVSVVIHCGDDCEIVVPKRQFIFVKCVEWSPRLTCAFQSHLPHVLHHYKFDKEDCLLWKLAQIPQEFYSSPGRVNRLSADAADDFWRFRLDLLLHSDKRCDMQRATVVDIYRSYSSAVACAIAVDDVMTAASETEADEACKWSQLEHWVEVAADIYCTTPQCLEFVIVVAFCVKLSVAV